MALIAAVAIGLVISRTVTGPLVRLTSEVGEISAGYLDKRTEVGAAGEVGTLVDAFNQMLDRIASTYRSQRELLANIAHELRTPLASIQGYAQALRDGVIQDEDARNRALDTITDEARRITELVEQILQLSRLESGQLPIHFAPTVIGEVLERVERQFAPIAIEKGVRLVIDRDTEMQAVIDEDLIARALGNLTANAIRHTDAGGAVEVRASRVSIPGRPAGIRLTVRDGGEGISDEQLERIFERFYRVGDRSTQHDSRNFGLGLAIVHEIVSRHGGEMSVASTPGQGTTFTIDLPPRQDNGSQGQRT
ncbi:hypothetical protein BH23CHL2_BH23CHL2_09660 [soil metagenome]